MQTKKTSDTIANFNPVGIGVASVGSVIEFTSTNEHPSLTSTRDRTKSGNELPPSITISPIIGLWKAFPQTFTTANGIAW